MTRLRHPALPTEHQEQVAVIQWWALACRRWNLPEFALFAVPNGGGRSTVGAALLKAEGVRRGVSDLFLAVPNTQAKGAFIEMKRTKGGRLSEEQENFISFVRTQGYAAAICDGAAEAIDYITEYINGTGAG